MAVPILIAVVVAMAITVIYLSVLNRDLADELIQKRHDLEQCRAREMKIKSLLERYEHG